MGSAGRRSTVGAIAGGLTGLISGFVQQQLLADRLAEERRRHEEDRQFRRELADRDYQGQLRRERTQRRQFGQSIDLQRDQLEANTAHQSEMAAQARQQIAYGRERDTLQTFFNRQDRDADVSFRNQQAAREDRRYTAATARSREESDRAFMLQALAAHLENMDRDRRFGLDVNKAILGEQGDAARQASSLIGQYLRNQGMNDFGGDQEMTLSELTDQLRSMTEQLTPPMLRGLGRPGGGAGGNILGDVKKLLGAEDEVDPALAPALAGQGAAAPTVPGPTTQPPTAPAPAQRSVAPRQRAAELKAIAEELFQAGADDSSPQNMELRMLAQRLLGAGDDEAHQIVAQLGQHLERLRTLRPGDSPTKQRLRDALRRLQELTGY